MFSVFHFFDFLANIIFMSCSVGLVAALGQVMFCLTEGHVFGLDG